MSLLLNLCAWRNLPATPVLGRFFLVDSVMQKRINNQKPVRWDNLGGAFLRRGLLNCSLALSLALSLPLCLASQPAFASISQDSGLAKLEIKFFKHTYPNDADEARLDRLEKMIFGEVRTGADVERLKNLAATVPNLNDLPASEGGADSGTSSSSGAGGRDPGAQADSGSSSSASSSSASSGRRSGKRSTASSAPASGSSSSTNDDDNIRPDKVLAGESKYPAVTALEQHLFKRDYANEAVGDRLNRMETKVFGHPSKFTDLSERVDALKEKTNVDIANQPPAGTDWTADDDDGSGHSFPVPRRTEPVARADGEDGRSFSGRDVTNDLRKAFGIGAGGSLTGAGGSGAYGMGGTSAGRSRGNSASGAYGMGGMGRSGDDLAMAGGGSDRFAPSSPKTSSKSKTSSARSSAASAAEAAAQAASDARAADSTVTKAPPPTDDLPDLPPSQTNPIYLNNTVGRLETSVLHKSYAQDPLITRLGRLEKSVFPNEPESELAMPQRVARLLKKVPSASETASVGRSSRGRGTGYANSDYGSGGGSGSGSGSGSNVASRSGGSSRRHSGWIDEDADMGYGKKPTIMGDDYDSSSSSSVPDVIGIGTGTGGSSSSMMGSGMGAGMNGMSGGQVQQPKGLGNIINKMGRALSGGNGYTGGYNVNSGNLRTDPSTGMLVDSMTGNVINPSTGAVINSQTSFSGTGAPIYSGTQLGGGLGGIGIGLGGLGGIGGIGGLGGLPMGGVGYGGLPPGYAYGGVPFGSAYGGMPYGYAARPYGYGMPMNTYPGFNNGFGPYRGMNNLNPARPIGF